MSNLSKSPNKPIKIEEIEERTFSSSDSNRGHVVATAVKEACRIALHQDWNAACRFILQNKTLTNEEKSAIINLLIK